MKVYTIGFTKKNAERFFGLLQEAGAKSVVDVRSNNVSQLAGFTKKDDLRYFLQRICGMSYRHVPGLAPTKELRDEYKGGASWGTYEAKFLELMKERRIEERIERGSLKDACLLCSEAKPDHCHRRLVAEYLKDRWGDVEIEHLV